MPILVKNGRVYSSTSSGSSIGGGSVEMTQAQYDALQNPDPNIIYFITDEDANSDVTAEDIEYDNTVSGTASAATTSQFTAKLFATHTSETSSAIKYYCSIKCYNSQIYKSNILVRDYIPFKFKENSTCGLYDKVENKIYLNAGSGSFTCG